ncbi:MAG: hypothetical protein FWG29_00300 [Treponema sp.]|nr:hypothetical protein [Treponema sp.]
MKRIIFISILCLSAAALFAQKAGDTNYINVKSANLKSSTGFFASTTGTVAYGDEVRILAISGNYAQVRTTAGNKTGWIAKSSLTSKRIAASGSAANASAREIALAGKGFSPEVEAQYKKEGGTINYTAVDEMEKIIISDRDLLNFIEEGRLAKGE